MSNDRPALLAQRRASEDNNLWTPEDCARALLAAIEDGELKPTKMVVLALTPDGDGAYTRDYFAANISTLEHLGCLEAIKHKMAREVLL